MRWEAANNPSAGYPSWSNSEHAVHTVFDCSPAARADTCECVPGAPRSINVMQYQSRAGCELFRGKCWGVWGAGVKIRFFFLDPAAL